MGERRWPDEIWLARYGGLLAPVSSREEAEESGAAAAHHVLASDYDEATQELATELCEERTDHQALRDSLAEEIAEHRKLAEGDRVLADYAVKCEEPKGTAYYVGGSEAHEHAANRLQALLDQSNRGEAG